MALDGVAESFIIRFQDFHSPWEEKVTVNTNPIKRSNVGDPLFKKYCQLKIQNRQIDLKKISPY